MAERTCSYLRNTLGNPSCSRELHLGHLDSRSRSIRHDNNELKCYVVILYLPYCFCRANEVPKRQQKDVVFIFAELFCRAFSGQFQRGDGVILMMVSLLLNVFSFL